MNIFILDSRQYITTKGLHHFCPPFSNTCIGLTFDHFMNHEEVIKSNHHLLCNFILKRIFSGFNKNIVDVSPKLLHSPPSSPKLLHLFLLHGSKENLHPTLYTFIYWAQADTMSTVKSGCKGAIACHNSG